MIIVFFGRRGMCAKKVGRGGSVCMCVDRKKESEDGLQVKHVYVFIRKYKI